MSTVARISVPLYRKPVDPALRPGIGELYVWLLVEKSYHQHAREQIVRHVASTGTLEGAAYLDPEDRTEAEEVFTEALEPVPFDDPAWEDPAVYLDRESILEAAAGSPGDADRSIPAGAVLIPPELDDFDQPEVAAIPAGAGIAPVSGGSPDDEDPMAFPPSRPSAPLPNRLTAEALGNVRRILESYDRPW